MADLVLYGTQGCHLCDMAEQLIAKTLDLRACSVALIDIAEDDCLIEIYGVRIPVISETRSGRELSWPFDAQQLQTFVTEILKD